jgi:hypothetical protein
LGKCFEQSANPKELVLAFFAPPSNFLVKRFINPNSFSIGLGVEDYVYFSMFSYSGIRAFHRDGKP